MFSVVIPAHNESQVIERCLRALTQGSAAKQLDILVVCNGCQDDTAERARRFDHVTVLDLEEASKVVALNAGDRAAKHFPIAYVDADVVVSADTLVATIKELESHPHAEVAAPKLHVDYERASFAVKSFYKVWTSLPYFTKGQMVGSGIFILTEKGRSRFSDFPTIISDDGFVRSLFKGQERMTSRQHSFTIFAPTTLDGLIKIKTRARFGNMEVQVKYPASDIGNDNRFSDLLKLLLKKPWWAVSIAIYIYVQFQTKRLARTRFEAADFTTWERDDTSRGGAQ